METSNIEQVLQQDDWLRRMAKGLVGDTHAAEDLAQEAWLVDLESGHRARDQRSWLSGVVGNLSRRNHRRRRSDAARRRRAAEQLRHAPATDEVVGLEQLKRRVAEELLELSDDQRTVVHLVYLAEHPLSEAARRMGIARSTAHHHLRRGLETLRARLDERHGGSRAPWTLALAPLVPGGRVQLVPGAAGSPPALAWGAAGLLVAVLAAALSLAMLASGHRPGTQEDASVGAATPAALSTPGVRVESPAALERRRPAAEPATAQGEDTPAAREVPSSRLGGRFLLPDGAPASGARFRVWGFPSNDQRVALFGKPDRWKPIEGALDEQGRLDLRFHPPQAYQLFLDVRARDAATASWRFSQIATGGEKLLGTVKLRPEAILYGRVLGPDGAAYVRQQRRIRVQEARKGDGFTDRDLVQVIVEVPEGEEWFEVRGMPAGKAEVHVSAAGMVRAQEFEVSLDAAEPIERDFQLDELPELRRTVVVRFARGPFGIDSYPDPRHVRVVDDAGLDVPFDRRDLIAPRIEIEPGVAQSLEVFVEDPRFAPWSSGTLLPGEQKVARLTGAGRLAIRALDPGGAPLGGFDLRLLKQDGNGSRSILHHRDEPLPVGPFTGVPCGRFDVELRAKGLVGRHQGVAVAAGEVTEITVQMQASSSLRGRALLDDGTRALDAEIHLLQPARANDSFDSPISFYEAGGDTSRLRQSVAASRVFADGTFEFEEPPRGQHVLVARRLGNTWALSDPFEIGAESLEVNLTIPRGGMVRGRVELPAVLPRDGWQVWVGWEGWRSDLDFRDGALPLDALQEFTALGLPEGRVEIYLRREGGGTQFVGDGRPARSFRIGHAEVESGGLVEVDLRFDGGAPAQLSLGPGPALGGRQAKGAMVFPAGTELGAQIRLVLGPKGSFEPIVLEPGSYHYQVWGEDWAVLGTKPVDLAAGESVDLTVDDVPVSREVRFVMDGEPTKHRRVTVRTHGLLDRSFAIDAGGEASIALNAGTFEAVFDDGRSPFPGWGEVWTPFVWPPLAPEVEVAH